MFRISKLTDYATILLVELAPAPVAWRSAISLSNATSIELPTVAKLMKLLTAAGLAESKRGAAGGYRLQRLPAAISLKHVLEAIEGPVQMTACGPDRTRCALRGHCSVRSHWQHIGRAVATLLSESTIADLAKASKRSAISARIGVADSQLAAGS